MSGTISGNSNLLQEYDDQIRLYQSCAAEVEHQIRNIINASGINCNAIVSRVKARDSIAEKAHRKEGKYSTISDITDVVGVRIITYYSDDVDKIAKIIEREFDVDKENSIDKRTALEPDRFGYCSVHYVVKMSPERLALLENRAFEGIKFEIQIRSVLQHAWAEIEHDIGYKSEITIPREMRRSFSRIAGLLEIADKEFNQIRGELAKYKADAQAQITDEVFLDRELDGVILEVIINSNPFVKRLNQHIVKLFHSTLGNVANNEDYVSTINRLNWVGIKTVQQLNDALAQYSQLAQKIASEILKDYERKDSSKTVRPTIAFFYLCYAILLSNCKSKEQVSEYFSDTNIALSEERDKVIQEIYDLKRLVES